MMLRHWFIGDGSAGEYSCGIRNGIQRTIWQMSLATYGFKEKDIEFLIEQLRRLGIRGEKNRRDAGICIRIAAESFDKFYDLIGPCPIDCYQYKWIPDEYKKEREQRRNDLMNKREKLRKIREEKRAAVDQRKSDRRLDKELIKKNIRDAVCDCFIYEKLTFDENNMMNNINMFFESWVNSEGTETSLIDSINFFDSKCKLSKKEIEYLNEMITKSYFRAISKYVKARRHKDESDSDIENLINECMTKTIDTRLEESGYKFDREDKEDEEDEEDDGYYDEY